jgi:hypothetical protein
VGETEDSNVLPEPFRDFGGLAIEAGDFPLSRVHLMPDVLQWEAASRAGSDTVFDAYVAFVSEALACALRDGERQGDTLARNLAAKLQTVPSPNFFRVVLAPDVTCRLLWRHPDRVQRVSEFLDKALHVEAVISGREEADCDAWTALGDMKVLQSGEILRAADIPGLPPLDLDSPNIASGEFVSIIGHGEVRFRSLSHDVRPVVIDRMTSAWDEISATSKLVADFIAKFVQVFVLRSDNIRTEFSSGSYRRYIGRVVMGNPHSDSVSDIGLAEAMVHEAIHALLYMALYTVPWGVDSNRMYTKGVRIVSPWTGAPLNVSSFLQACFVWYGLVHFWSLALRRESFNDTHGTRLRMARALEGFVGSPLVDNLCSEDRKIVRDDVITAIEKMQSRAKTLATGA